MELQGRQMFMKRKKEPSLEGFLSLKCGRWDLNPSLSSKTLEKWRVPRIMLSFVPKFVPRMINKKAVSGFEFLTFYVYN